jgi:hypothetical protein
MNDRQRLDTVLAGRVVDVLRQFPGAMASNFSRAQRRVLERMEEDGVIVRRLERGKWRWYLTR